MGRAAGPGLRAVAAGNVEATEDALERLGGWIGTV
jgi:hypothetical protein